MRVILRSRQHTHTHSHTTRYRTHMCCADVGPIIRGAIAAHDPACVCRSFAALRSVQSSFVSGRGWRADGRADVGTAKVGALLACHAVVDIHFRHSYSASDAAGSASVRVDAPDMMSKC